MKALNSIKFEFYAIVVLSCIFLNIPLQAETLEFLKKSPFEILSDLKNNSPNIINNGVDDLGTIKNQLVNLGITGASFQTIFPKLASAEKFHFKNHTVLTQIIDEIIFRAINLKRVGGREGLCAATPSNPLIFMTRLGLTNVELGQQAYQICKNQAPATINVYGSHYLRKDFIFVKIPKELMTEYSMRAWSNNSNTTYLFITENSNWTDVSLSILHELAVTFDSKFLQYAYQYRDKYSLTDFQADLFARLSPVFASVRALHFEKLAYFDFKNSDEIMNSSERWSALEKIYNELYSALSILTPSMGIESYYLAQEGKVQLSGQELDLLRKELKLYPELLESIFEDLTTPLLANSPKQTINSYGPSCLCGGSLTPDQSEEFKQFLLKDRGSIKNNSELNPSNKSGLDFFQLFNSDSQ